MVLTNFRVAILSGMSDCWCFKIDYQLIADITTFKIKLNA